MNFKNRLSQIALGASMVLAACGAHAELYDFTITGAYAASFQLDASPAVSADFQLGQLFHIEDVSGSFQGAVSETVDLYFRSTAQGGGLQIDDYYADLSLFKANGAQLYTGAENMPAFTPGTFTLTQAGGTDSYTLTISPAAPIPEPTSITLMLGGMGLMGVAALRRRRN